MSEMRATVPVWQRVPVFAVTAGLLWLVAGPPVEAILRGQHVSGAPPSVISGLFAVVLCYRLTGLFFRAWARNCGYATTSGPATFRLRR